MRRKHQKRTPARVYKALQAELDRQKRRADNEEGWRIEIAQDVKKWRAKFLEQEQIAQNAAMHELQIAEAQKLSNEKFQEVFDAVTGAYDRGCNEKERRKGIEAERQLWVLACFV